MLGRGGRRERARSIEHVLVRLRADTFLGDRGYSTMLWEIDDELERRKEAAPDLVVVQIGVGSFAAAVTRHFRGPHTSKRPKLLGVEPADAACLLRSVEEGRIVSVHGPHHSIMAGLNCGRPSLVAWPIVSRGIDVLVAMDDGPAREAVRLMAASGVVSGETGAAGLRRPAVASAWGEIRRSTRATGGGPQGAGCEPREPRPTFQL